MKLSEAIQNIPEGGYGVIGEIRSVKGNYFFVGSYNREEAIREARDRNKGS